MNKITVQLYWSWHLLHMLMLDNEYTLKILQSTITSVDVQHKTKLHSDTLLLLHLPHHHMNKINQLPVQQLMPKVPKVVSDPFTLSSRLIPKPTSNGESATLPEYNMEDRLAFDTRKPIPRIITSESRL